MLNTFLYSIAGPHLLVGLPNMSFHNRKIVNKLDHFCMMLKNMLYPKRTYVTTTLSEAAQLILKRLLDFVTSFNP